MLLFIDLITLPTLTYFDTCFYSHYHLRIAPHVPPQVAAPAQAQGTNKHAAAVHLTAALNAGIVRTLFAVVAVVAVVLLLIVFVSTIQHHLGTTHHSRSTLEPTSETTTSYTTCIVQLLVYVLLIVVFVVLRLGTLRIYGTDDSGEVVHNHKETDERVFEVSNWFVLTSNSLLSCEIYES